MVVGQSDATLHNVEHHHIVYNNLECLRYILNLQLGFFHYIPILPSICVHHSLLTTQADPHFRFLPLGT